MKIYTDYVEGNISYPDGCDGDIYAGCKVFADLRLERDVHISFDVKIIGKGAVEIGKGSSLAPNCVLYTSRPDMIKNGKNGFCDSHEAVVGDILIGENVFLGANTVVEKGVTIADNVVVGANSYVSSDLSESGYLYAGNPARKIKELESVCESQRVSEEGKKTEVLNND